MDRLLFLPLGICLCFISVYLHLPYIHSSVLMGIGLALSGMALGAPSYFTTSNGYSFLLAGLICLGVASYICHRHQISFAELSGNLAFPRRQRHLPSVGISLVSCGIVVFCRAVFADK